VTKFIDSCITSLCSIQASRFKIYLASLDIIYTAFLPVLALIILLLLTECIFIPQMLLSKHNAER